mgnify:CR=1 FL=1
MSDSVTRSTDTTSKPKPRCQRLTPKLIKQLTERGQSELCEVRDSPIHGYGVYATQDLGKEDRIIEYVGQKITKKESEKRGIEQQDLAEQHGEAAVYIFTLDEDYDIDGNFDWNPARLINHSCNPNCEAWIEDEKGIAIYSLREIKKGEELTFDYGFDISCCEDHPCLCGSPDCVGYIVSRSQWKELKRRIAAGELS